MSTYMKIETQFHDRDILKAALSHVCAVRGIPFEENATAHGWNNAQIAAAFIIRKQYTNPYEDLAFVALPDGGFAVLIGSHDSVTGPQIVREVKQHYAAAKVEKAAMAHGLRVERMVDGGTIRMRLTGRRTQHQQVRIR